jgi:hypothetical protein
VDADSFSDFARSGCGNSEYYRGGVTAVSEGWREIDAISYALRCCGLSGRLSQIEDQNARLGHFFDCVAQPFAARAGVLHAAVGHVVNAER